ncbi:MAG: transcriptional regulator MraZ [Planctomycetota bacterium]
MRATVTTLGPTTPNERPTAPRRATFFGTAFHKVSGRNQVAIPRNLMKTLEESNEGQLLLMRWNDEGFLRLYTQTQLDTIIDNIRQRQDLDEATKAELVAHLSGGAEPIEPDKQGRFVLPAAWVDQLGMREEVAFCGAFNRIELWPAEARRDYDQKKSARIAETAMKVTGLLNL